MTTKKKKDYKRKFMFDGEPNMHPKLDPKIMQKFLDEIISQKDTKK